MKQIKVLEDNIRLDHYLVKVLKENRSLVTKIIKEKKVFVNDQLVKVGFLLKSGDLIKILKYENKELKLTPLNLDLNIIYEDDDILIVNKPKNLVVHPAKSYDGPTLVEALLSLDINLSNINDKFRPGIIHRLDKDTSGLVIIAKTNQAHKILAKALKSHEVKRYYYALVNGVLANDHGVIDARIGRDPKKRIRNAVISTGKRAVTHYEVIQRFKKNTLLKIELVTGRTHQIRVHLSYIDHYIVGDTLYGVNPPQISGGQMLHAYKLVFTHPITKKEMEFETPLPENFIEFTKQLI